MLATERRSRSSREIAQESANFHLADLKGNQWSLKQLKGKVALVNVWATWCPPCQQEMPALNALYRKYKDSGLVVLGITDEESTKVKQFIQTKGYGYPILIDPGGKVIQNSLQVTGRPVTIVYDRRENRERGSQLTNASAI